ncbi:MAG: DUF1573 domain-containing protein [Paludibacteraceae bacterium]|nr:DUF1573 domain-containing protein [Paludibacteraceae bacterium]
MKKSFLMSALLLIAAAAMAQQPVITFQKTEHDFGKINEGDGRVSTIFEFKNEGMEPLVLSNVRASCGCTTPTWTKTPIEPGETGSITVTYNPNGRPGRFSKTVTITSNASNGTTKVYIKGEVIPKQAKPVNQYNIKMGELSLKTKTVNFGTLLKGTNKTQTIEYANLTDHDITVGLNYDNTYLQAVLSFTTLKPQETGTLNLNFDTERCKQWGPVKAYAWVIVNGKEVRTDEFALTLLAEIEEDFSQMSVSEKQQAPIAEIPAEFDLGNVKAGQKASKKISIKNAGVNPLNIRAVVNNNPENLTIGVQKQVIKGGKQANLNTTVSAVKPDGTPLAAGTYRRQIEVITNDPQRPKSKITLVWTVE